MSDKQNGHAYWIKLGLVKCTCTYLEPSYRPCPRCEADHSLDLLTAERDRYKAALVELRDRTNQELDEINGYHGTNYCQCRQMERAEGPCSWCEAGDAIARLRAALDEAKEVK